MGNNSSSSAQNQQQHPINTFPTEILLALFSHLPQRSLIVASAVCRLWRSLILSEPLLLQGRVFKLQKHTNSATFLLRAWRAVDALDVSWCASGLEAISNLPHLRVITFDCCPNLTDQLVAAVVRTCPSVRGISIARCPSLTPHVVSILAQARDLRILNLADQPFQNIHLLAACTNLEVLDLSGMAELQDSHVDAQCTDCPNLRQIDLSRCRKLTIDVAASLVKCTALRRLSLAGCFGSTAVATPANLLQLRKLDLSDLRLNSSSFSSLPRLHSLKLNWCSLGSAILRDITSCVRLRSLHLDGAVLPEWALRALAAIPDLRSLVLLNCRFVSSDGEALMTLTPASADPDTATDANLVSILFHPRLIRLTASQLDDTAVCALARRCPLLRRVELFCCSSLTASALNVLLAQCPNLEVLHFTYAPGVDDSVASGIAVAPRLHTLKFSGDRISPVTARRLAEITRLTSVDFHNHKRDVWNPQRSFLTHALRYAPKLLT